MRIGKSYARLLIITSVIVVGVSSGFAQGIDAAKLRGIVVDDEALIRFGLEKFVKKEGFEAITASNGKKALEIIF